MVITGGETRADFVRRSHTLAAGLHNMMHLIPWQSDDGVPLV
jgi:hypothetical protein